MERPHDNVLLPCDRTKVTSVFKILGLLPVGLVASVYILVLSSSGCHRPIALTQSLALAGLESLVSLLRRGPCLRIQGG